MMEIYCCLCCGCKTLASRGEFDICPVCFWEDDAYLIFDTNPITSMYYEDEPSIKRFLDIPSSANHGLTLRQGRTNYLSFGACEKSMLPHVRLPRDSEK